MRFSGGLHYFGESLFPSNICMYVRMRRCILVNDGGHISCRNLLGLDLGSAVSNRAGPLRVATVGVCSAFALLATKPAHVR